MGMKWQEFAVFPKMDITSIGVEPRCFATALISLRNVGHPAYSSSQADHPKNKREKYDERSNYHNIDDLLSKHLAGSERSGRKRDTYENGARAGKS
jgi:hypothetical protein